MSLGARGVGFGPLLLRQWRLKRGLLIPLPRCSDVSAKVLNSKRRCSPPVEWPSPARIGSLSRSAIERVRRKVKMRSEVFWRWRHSGWPPQDFPGR